MFNKSKKLHYSGEDRISALPDHLVHHILSFLVLKQMITTSVLSKRWRFLWTSVPVIDLGDWRSKYLIPSSITNSLIQYRGQKITKFRVYFDYYKLGHENIDTWIKFAVNRDVKEFDLSLLHKDWGYDGGYDFHVNYQVDGYKLLGCLLNCESLEVLKLTFCKLNLNVTSSNLRLLKKLELRFMWLSNLDTSGCPLLESIILYRCNVNQPLDIYAPNLKLRFLKIKDFNCAHPVTLFAPNLKSIQFEDKIREAYNIMNLSSLTTVSFELVGGFMVGKDTTPQFMELLQGLLHASTLRLNHGFMELLSLLDTGVKLPPCASTCLELKINMQKSDIIGMVHILRSAYTLETLILDICSPCIEDQHLGAWDLGIWDFGIWESLGHSLSSIWSLKNVEIKNFLKSESDMLYKKWGPKSSIDTFLVNNWDKEIELVKILLKNCMILETMNISTIDIPSWTLKSEVLLLALTKRLLTIPRASTKAEIHFSSSPK